MAWLFVPIGTAKKSRHCAELWMSFFITHNDPIMLLLLHYWNSLITSQNIILVNDREGHLLLHSLFAIKHGIWMINHLVAALVKASIGNRIGIAQERVLGVVA